MSKEQIDLVLDRVRSWPSERQEDAIRTLTAMEREGVHVFVLDAEDHADIDEAEAELARGETPVPHDEALAIFRRLKGT